MSWNNSGEPRFGIHSIDHFALEVPSLSEAARFFGAFGLRALESAGKVELRSVGSDHTWARLYEGPQRRMAYLSLSCYEEEFHGLCEQVQAAGARDAGASPYVDGSGRWFLDPDENLVQLKVGPKTTPSRPSATVQERRVPGKRGVLARGAVKTVHPRRLSHAVMFTSSVDRSVSFYRDVLGMRLSDRSRDAVAFMHGRHGSDHHLLAFVASSSKGWHHSAWDVADVNEVGAGAEQMRKAGYFEGWGTGRHVLGSNFFHYVRDPWGSFAEFSAEMDFVPVGTQWPAADHPPEDSLYLWGPSLPDNFVTNSEAPDGKPSNQAHP
jgi:catechol 2,3-dioxygenase-like lactoylglutathione lyase family enzyme